MMDEIFKTWQALAGWCDRMMNRQRLLRRLALIWACWLITVVVLRVTDPAVLADVDGAVATVVTAVIGILATVVAFYQRERTRETLEQRRPGSNPPASPPPPPEYPRPPLEQRQHRK